jgi:Mitochondrial resolvase Ydc2, catalytic.
MKILSIDVGIKNLAFCLFEKSENSDYFKITKWDTVNISEQHEIKNCIFIDKIGLCNKPAKFSKEDQCFCLKHY